MIKNWNTIETIVSYIKTARVAAKLCIAPAAKKACERVARKWERLLTKFAESCQLIEVYIVSQVARPNLRYHIVAINADAAVKLVLRNRPWIRDNQLSAMTRNDWLATR